jgi:hypothetical protein
MPDDRSPLLISSINKHQSLMRTSEDKFTLVCCLDKRRYELTEQGAFLIGTLVRGVSKCLRKPNAAPWTKAGPKTKQERTLPHVPTCKIGHAASRGISTLALLTKRLLQYHYPIAPPAFTPDHALLSSHRG